MADFIETEIPGRPRWRSTRPSIAPRSDTDRGQASEVAAADEMAFVEAGPALSAHFDRCLAVDAQDLHPNGYANGLIAKALHAPLRDALACPPRAAEHS